MQKRARSSGYRLQGPWLEALAERRADVFSLAEALREQQPHARHPALAQGLCNLPHQSGYVCVCVHYVDACVDALVLHPQVYMR